MYILLTTSISLSIVSGFSQVQVYPPSVFNLHQTLCFGDSLIINGALYNESHPEGTEIIPGGGINGSDSIIHIQLTFYPEATYNLNLYLCPNENFIINERKYDHSHPSGMEVLEGASYLGCDSTIYINLKYFPPAIGSLMDTLYEGDSLVIHGTVYDQFRPSGKVYIPGGNTYGCDSIVRISLYFKPLLSVEPEPLADNFYTPTIFSPNGDGVNDVWKIYSPDPDTRLINLQIFDRWGGLVYHCANKLLSEPEVEWDGTLSGNEMETGVYVFQAQVSSGAGEITQLRGGITVVR